MNLERKPIQCFTEIATKIISDLELGNLFFLYSYSYYLLSLFDLSNLFHLSNLFDSCTLFFLLCTRLCFEDQPTDRQTNRPTMAQSHLKVAKTLIFPIYVQKWYYLYIIYNSTFMSDSLSHSTKKTFDFCLASRSMEAK